MAVHPNSLANLKPARRGEVRNPRGVNRYTKDKALKARYEAICIALANCEDDDEQQVLIHEIVDGALEGALRGDNLLLYFLVSRLWVSLSSVPSSRGR